MRATFLAVFMLLPLAVISVAADIQTSETDCNTLCSENDYASTYNCYKGSRSKADASLVTAHCALVNKDDDAAEEYALKSAGQRMGWVSMLNKLHIPKVKIHTGGTAESYMTAYVASGDEKHKEKSIAYARTSGQCDGADNEQACAEAYFNSYVDRISKRNSVTGRNTNPELAEKTCNGLSEYYSFFTGQCKCKKGYESLGDECTLGVFKNTKLTTESAVDLETKFQSLAFMQADVMELNLLGGKTKKIALQKKPNGAPVFSEDGIEWETDLKKITNPGLKDKISGAWEWTENLNPVNWFGTKWKDDAPGQNKQVKWEIAEKVLEEFKEESADPASYEEQFAEWFVWALEQPDSWEEFLGDIEDKEILEVASEKGISAVKDSLYEYFIGFPAASITKFAEQLQTDDFFQGVYYYIRERETGRTQQDIMANQPEEMEFAVSLATVHTFGQEMYSKKLEEAYQRYLVWKRLQE